LATFMQSDQTIQNILGAFNTQLGVNNNDISGAAIVEAMTQSNGSGMPYIVNFMLAWNQVAEIYLDLFPKIYMTPRTLPIMDNMRNPQIVPINGFGGQGISTQYSPNALNVEVEAGMNFEVQKNRSVMQMQALATAFPALAELINTKGLPILLDNLDFRGVDTLKQLATEMLQEQAQQKQQGQQQPNPLTLKMQDLAMRNQHKMADLQLDAQKLKQDQIKMTMDYQGQQQEQQIEMACIKAYILMNQQDVASDHLDRAHDMLKHGLDHRKDTVHKMADHEHAMNLAEHSAQAKREMTPKVKEEERAQGENV